MSEEEEFVIGSDKGFHVYNPVERVNVFEVIEPVEKSNIRLSGSPVFAHIGMVCIVNNKEYEIINIDRHSEEVYLEHPDGNRFWHRASINGLADAFWKPAEDFTIEPRVKCTCCGKFVCEDDSTETVDDLVCSECLEEYYTQCYSCNEWVCNDDIRTNRDNGHGYCYDCFDSMFTECEECGDIIYRENAFYDEDSERDLCLYCYDHRDDDGYGSLDDYVYSYCKKISPIFHSDKTRSTDSMLYFGLELEMEADRDADDLLELAEALYDSTDRDWYLKQDGSLRYGLEVVTQPRTYESWQKFYDEFDRRVLKKALEYNCTGHKTGTCGIHIHTSLDAWEGSQLFRLFSLLYNKKNYKDILTISQRRSEQINRWASLEFGDIGHKKKCIEDKKSPFGERYAALNITETTLEFRLFNSSLRLDRVKKNIEFVYALYRFTAERQRVSWRGFKCWVCQNKQEVPNLHEFMLVKGIIDSKIIIQDVENINDNEDEDEDESEVA